MDLKAVIAITQRYEYHAKSMALALSDGDEADRKEASEWEGAAEFCLHLRKAITENDPTMRSYLDRYSQAEAIASDCLRLRDETVSKIGSCDAYHDHRLHAAAHLLKAAAEVLYGSKRPGGWISLADDHMEAMTKKEGAAC